MKIVFHGVLVYDLLETLKGKLAFPVELSRFKGDEPYEERAKALDAADVVIAMRYQDLPPSPKLRLLHVPGAGIDQITMEQVPASAFVCNAYGHDNAAAEYSVLAMLAWYHRFVEAHETLKAGDWRMSGWYGAPLHDELMGKTVGVLGLGPIGLATARLAKAFNTTVLGCNRTVRERPPYVDGQFPLSDLHVFLARCDAVVVAIANTEQTTGIIDTAALGAMKRDALIVNVARGPVIDEEALYVALRDRTIGGAVIDCWYTYPAPGRLQQEPSRFPFHELPNILMTPHSSIWTRQMIDRRWSQIAGNITAIANGHADKLQNVVRAPQAAV